MTFTSVIIVLFILLLAPFTLGHLLPTKGNNMLRIFVQGYFVEWTIFMPVALAFILRGDSFTKLCNVYTVILLLVIATSVIVWFLKNKNAGRMTCERIHKKLTKTEIVVLGAFIALILFQLYKTLFYAYADGDDAFYIATAQTANISDKMYLIEPYTGVFLSKDNVNYRYALAPFPMWIAYTARLSGLNVATVAYIFVPVIFIGITYTIYYEISKRLFKDSREKQLIFMVISTVIIMFSNVSTSTAETFLLTRARQGKEALANIVLPFMFLIMYEVFEKLKENEKCIKISDIIMLLLVGASAGLMSVFGNLLFGISIVAYELMLIVYKKKIRVMVDMAMTAIPSGILLLLYIFLH